MINETVRKSNEGRIFYLDVLRILSILFVIILHVSEDNWLNTSVSTYEWQVMNFFDSISRWCVPVLIMISGSLFLNRDIPIKKIYGKYILRLFIAFLFWSFCYSFIFNLLQKRSFSAFITSFVKGHYHLWYLYMIIGLYMITPFIRKIAIDQKLTKYFIILAIVFALLIPEIIGISSLFTAYSEWARSVIDQTHLQFVMGFTVYYLTGYYLNGRTLNKRISIIIYILGLLGFTFTIFSTSLISTNFSVPIGWFYGYQTINVFLESISVFVLIKNLTGRKQFGTKMTRRISALSRYSFGAYLIHALIVSMLDTFISLNSLSFNPIISIPGLSMLVFIISYGLSALLNQLPIIRNHLV